MRKLFFICALFLLPVALYASFDVNSVTSPATVIGVSSPASVNSVTNTSTGVTYDNKTTSDVASDSDSVVYEDATISIGQSSGNDRFVIVLIIQEGGSNYATSVEIDPDGTFNDDGDEISFTDLGSEVVSGWTTVETWYCLDADLPASSGSYDIRVTYASDEKFMFYVGSFYGVSQAAPSYVTEKDSGAPTSISEPITTSANNSWLVDVVGIRNVVSDLTPDAGQTERGSYAGDAFSTGWSTEIKVTAGSETIGWSWTGDGNDALIMISSLEPS